MNIPDHHALTPVGAVAGATPDETAASQRLAAEAESYLKGFSWCKAILASYAGILEPGIVGVFLHHIEPTTPEADKWLWSVVGDLPPAYLVTDEAQTPAEALEGYVGEMRPGSMPCAWGSQWRS